MTEPHNPTPDFLDTSPSVRAAARGRRVAQFVATASVCGSVGTYLAFFAISVSNKVTTDSDILSPWLLAWLWPALQAILLFAFVGRHRRFTGVCAALLLPAMLVSTWMFIPQSIFLASMVWSMFGLNILTVLPELAALAYLIGDRTYWTTAIAPVGALTRRRCVAGLVVPAAVAQLAVTVLIPMVMSFPNNALYLPVASVMGAVVALGLYELVVDKGLSRAMRGVGYAVVLLCWLPFCGYTCFTTASELLQDGHGLDPTRSPLRMTIDACWPLAIPILSALVSALISAARKRRKPGVHAETV
ncbi:hypothetical protein [Pseudonocardia spinosispora]|uniref:hypothetical protein n=1 Tax=Pseudonocardia spinosispora TaxID=103441 RepID=UPI00048D21B3|nr:hypothetical protein [Pseudonocardia spinosispora]